MRWQSDDGQDDGEQQSDAGDAAAVSDRLWLQAGHRGEGEPGGGGRDGDLEPGGQLRVPPLQHDQQHPRGQGEARALVQGGQDDACLQSGQQR